MQKDLFLQGRHAWHGLPATIFRSMRLTILLTFTCVVNLYATGYSQETMLTLSMKDVKLSQVFSVVQQRTDYQFLYNDEDVANAPLVSVSVRDATVPQILAICFRNYPLTYLIENKTVVVLSKPGARASRGVSVGKTEPQVTVKGQVMSQSGGVLIGVSVSLKGTETGTITDGQGFYALSVPDDKGVLVFSYVGYITKEVQMGGQSEMNVRLDPSVSALNQLVVVGYGTQKRSDLTGSISSIKGENVSDQAIRNPVQALTGLAAGVQTLQNSGAPGSTLSVIVRGDNSLLGSNEPLYVVDGFPYSGSLDNINPNDILSIEVLKDASATAIYGSRGSNGVVMITTKKGRVGKTSLEYEGYYGIQKITKTLHLLDARQFATLANTRAANDHIQPYFTQGQIDSFGKGTNWQDEIFRTAPIQNHTLRVSGGDQRTLFNISGNYLDQQGIIIGSKYYQGQLKVDLSHNINSNWKISFDGIMNSTVSDQLSSDNQERGLGVLSGALVAPPTLPVKNADGDYSNLRIYPFSPDILENPVAMALDRRQSSKNNALLSNMVVEGNLTKDLVFHTSIGLQYNMTRGDYYSPTIFQQTANGSASISYDELMHLVNENLLTYTKQLGQANKLVILAGVTTEKTTMQGDVASSSGFSNNTLENNSLQSGTIPGTPTSSYSKYTILSGLGRANYSYKDKYLLTASIRADGSSRFGESNKWGYFPSFAVAWRLSQESFWSPIKEVIDDLKLRGSWGQTGNTAVTPYQSLSVLSSVQTVFDDNSYVGFAPGTIKPNPNLKWETTTQTDVGADLGLFDDRISLSFDYYHKVTRDLLASVPLPLSSGYVTESANIGSIQNKGFDLSVNTRIISGHRFNWDLGATFTLNRNKVLSLADGTDIFGASLGNNLPAMSLVRVGQPIGVFYGYVEDGLTDDGQIKYKDLDGNGIINPLDREILGNPNPKYIFGLNTRLSYGGFGLSMIVNGIEGNDILAYDLSSIANGFYFGENQLTDVWGNYWTADKPNPEAKYPRISSSTSYLGSNRVIKDGSYVRLQNVQLSYTISGSQLKAAWFDNAEIYISAQNLIILTNYPLYSPDVNTRGAGISKGIDEMGYPDARTFLVGLRFDL